MRRPKPDGREDRNPGSGRTAKAILGALLFLSTALASYGQADPPRRIWGGSLGGIFPAGEFRDRIDRPGIGLSLFYGWRLGNMPVFVGGEFTVQEFGHSLFAEIDSYNAILQGLAFIRIRPRTGAVLTYLEGLAGVSYVTTETDYGWDEYGDSIVEIDSEDLGLTAGFGAGLSFRIGRRGANAGAPGRGTYLDLNVRYLTGGHADYLLVLPDGSFAPQTSRTSFVTAKVGLTYVF
jgi:hypothetical protein